MLPDLQHLIHLQEIDSAIDRARRRISEIPGTQQALESRLAERSAAVQAVKDRITATSHTRREIEKEVAAVQTRLSKYKEQLMAVKTNKEYQAMQTEIATAEGQVRSHEDRLLDLMEVTETESADLKAADAALKSEQAAIAAQQKALEAEIGSQQTELERLTAERDQLLPQISKDALTIFNRVAHGRKGIAVAEARDGLCVVCHVRLRPQMFNEVRRNAAIVQCDSCTRILYYVPPGPGRADTELITAYIDGGARGNPGPAGYGVYIQLPDGSVEELHGGLGIATNNVAEYNGLLAALRWAVEHGHSVVRVKADSELLVKQMRGEYKVKNAGLQPLAAKARVLIGQLDRVTFEHVRREQNKDADRLSNVGMDEAEEALRNPPPRVSRGSGQGELF